MLHPFAKVSIFINTVMFINNFKSVRMDAASAQQKVFALHAKKICISMLLVIFAKNVMAQLFSSIQGTNVNLV